MALDIGAIREALAAKVKAITDACEHPANVYAHPSGSPLTPAVLVLPNAHLDGQYVDYWQSSGQNPLCAIGLRLEVRVGTNEKDAAKVVDYYLSTVIPQVIAALESDRTLSGTCEAWLPRAAVVPAEFGLEGETRTWLSSSVAIEVRARRSTS